MKERNPANESALCLRVKSEAKGNRMKGNKLITRLVITFTIFVAILTCSCSSQKDTTESKINELKARVETVIVGYQDGTTIPLTKDSAQYEEILDECLEAIVSIDEHCTHVISIDIVEQKWKPKNKYVPKEE